MCSSDLDWVAQKRLSALAQIGLERHRDLADTPLLSELVGNDRDRALMTFVSRDATHARALAAPPGVPAARIDALRQAFDAMVKDEAFLAEARAARHDIAASDGIATGKAVSEELGAPRDVVERVKAMVAGNFR